MAPANSQETCSLAQLLAYFLRLGAFSFGGPNRTCRPNGPRPCRRAGVGLAAGLPRGPRVLATVSRTARRPTCHVHRLGRGRTARGALVAAAFIAPSSLM